MIKQYLEDHYNCDRLYNSYLINTDNLDQALIQIKQFINTKLLTNGILENHADYMLVSKIDNKTKNISIDQVRGIQDFVFKTSVLSGKKIVIIYAADQMNLNAANACLKILEDTPANSYIFLLTDNVSTIIPTIISRCSRINHYFALTQENVIDPAFLIPLINKTEITHKYKFITEFSSKDRNLWQKFSSTLQELMVKFCKKSTNIQCTISDQEHSVWLQFKSQSPQYLYKKYDKICQIINDTNEFDLDIRASCILLMDQFKS